MPSTPVLRWTPDPYASFYMVYVSEDASFTNLLEPSNRVPATTNTMYAPTLDNDAHTYADSQAGGAYYWYVRPCRNQFNCGPDPVSTIGQAQHSFVKRSPAVRPRALQQLLGQRHRDHVHLGRLLRHQPQCTRWPQTGEQRPQAAKQYRIQVNNVESFAGTLIDERAGRPDHLHLLDKLYPEGPLFWRVQAIDSDDNGLAWSDMGRWGKTPSPSPAPR